MENFESHLRKHNLRVTSQRKQLFGVLERNSQPLSLVEIQSKCKQVDKASVYRIIDQLVKLGVVKVVHVGWKNSYELADAFSPHSHHHHLRCIQCKKITHISNPAIEKMVHSIALRQNFDVTDHFFDIDGICSECQNRT